MRLRNDGYAPPVNPRPVFVVLHAGATAYLAELGGADADPRRWAPTAQGETRTLSRTIAVPASVGRRLPHPRGRQDSRLGVRQVGPEVATSAADTGPGSTANIATPG